MAARRLQSALCAARHALQSVPQRYSRDLCTVPRQSFSLLVQSRTISTSKVSCERSNNIETILSEANSAAERQELVDDLWRMIHGTRQPIPKDAENQLNDGDLARELKYLLPDPRQPSNASQSTKKPRFEDLPLDSPLRSLIERPSSAAFYTGNAIYYDILESFESAYVFLDEQLAESPEDARSAEHKSVLSSADITWLKRDEFEVKLGTPLRVLQYRELISRLHELRAHPMAHLVEEELSDYMRTRSKSQIDSKGRAYATGRRKASVARVWVSPGSGKFVVNKKTLGAYFQIEEPIMHAYEPLAALGFLGQYDVTCTVHGGGATGQAGAIRLGIARGLETLDESLRPQLRRGGFLTRDARVVESKKPGQKKARKKFQWVKR